MNQPLVSVVMPVRDVERFLAESIESILAQTFTDFEFIIVDFGSTDNSKSIVSRHAAKDERIKFLEIPACTLPGARNAGCQIAQGKYIAVMDADDVALPNRLLAEVTEMEAKPEIALLGAAVEWIDAKGKPLGVQRHPATYEEIKQVLPTRCTFWHPTVVVRRQAFVSVGGYRNAFIYAHDYDLALRFAENFLCANMQQVVLNYRVHPGQVTLQKQEEQTLCKLAAGASAGFRREHKRDPLDETRLITPKLLEVLGIEEGVMQNALALDCWNWGRSMIAAGEYAAAADAIRLRLGGRLKPVERWLIADLWLLLACASWKQGEFRRGISSASHAVLTRPWILGRPLRLLSR